MNLRNNPLKQQEPDLEDQASDLFMARLEGRLSASEREAFEARLVADARFAAAFARLESSWEAVGRHATSPELMALREHAIARARKASARRWLLSARQSWSIGRGVAAAALILVGCGIAWQLSPLGYVPGVYKTGLGEQKSIELPDHSRLVLDARTRLRVQYSADARIVELQEGQAQFSVAKDPRRPFKVEAGAKTIIAVGTVFDVAYIDREVQVAMVEGRVAVLSRDEKPATGVPERDSKAMNSSSLELSAGEGLQVGPDGSAAILPKADIEAATAWRQGKVIFRDTSLAAAVHRLNRYSRQQVVIDDPELARMRVNGVFDSGDAPAFAEAMQSYLPVSADFSQASTIHLRAK